MESVKRWICLLLAVCVMLTLLPGAAWGAETQPEESTAPEMYAAPETYADAGEAEEIPAMAVASVTTDGETVYYKMLGEAMDAMTENSVMKLLSILFSKRLPDRGTLDLNGNRLTLTADISITGTLTIRNSGESGGLELSMGVEEKRPFHMTVADGGALTLDGVTLTGMMFRISRVDGIWYDYKNSLTVQEGGSLRVKGGNLGVKVAHEGGSCVIEGGTFVGHLVTCEDSLYELLPDGKGFFNDMGELLADGAERRELQRVTVGDHDHLCDDSIAAEEYRCACGMKLAASITWYPRSWEASTEKRCYPTLEKAVAAVAGLNSAWYRCVLKPLYPTQDLTIRTGGFILDMTNVSGNVTVDIGDRGCIGLENIQELNTLTIESSERVQVEDSVRQDGNTGYVDRLTVLGGAAALKGCRWGLITVPEGQDVESVLEEKYSFRRLDGETDKGWVTQEELNRGTIYSVQAQPAPFSHLELGGSREYLIGSSFELEASLRCNEWPDSFAWYLNDTLLPNEMAEQRQDLRKYIQEEGEYTVRCVVTYGSGADVYTREDTIKVTAAFCDHPSHHKPWADDDDLACDKCGVFVKAFVDNMDTPQDEAIYAHAWREILHMPFPNRRVRLRYDMAVGTATMEGITEVDLNGRHLSGTMTITGDNAVIIRDTTGKSRVPWLNIRLENISADNETAFYGGRFEYPIQAEPGVLKHLAERNGFGFRNYSDGTLIQLTEDTVKLEKVEAFCTLHMGDVNADGAVDARDLQCLYDYLTAGTAKSFHRIVADCTGDGAVDVYDLQRLYEMICWAEA